MKPYKYFSYSEFDSPDLKGSGERFMSKTLIKKLDLLRENLGFPLRVTSGYRTLTHNLKVGGVIGSAHTKGLAVDLSAQTDDIKKQIAIEAVKLGFNRIGFGSVFVHLDIDKSKPQNVTWGYGKSPLYTLGELKNLA